ncbi:hypothetical protein ES702_02875 [subsurface metagenome]
MRADESRSTLLDHKIGNPYGLKYSITFFVDPDDGQVEVKETLFETGRLAQYLVCVRRIWVEAGEFTVLQLGDREGVGPSDDFTIRIMLKENVMFKVIHHVQSDHAGEQGDAMFLKKYESSIDDMRYLQVRISSHQKEHDAGKLSFYEAELRTILPAPSIDDSKITPTPSLLALQHAASASSRAPSQPVQLEFPPLPTTSTESILATVDAEPVAFRKGGLKSDHLPATSKTIPTSASRRIPGVELGDEYDLLSLDEKMDAVEEILRLKIGESEKIWGDVLQSASNFERAIKQDEMDGIAGSGHVGNEFYRLKEMKCPYEMADLCMLMGRLRVEKGKAASG